MKLYKSYRFRDKDPIIDVVRTLMVQTSTSIAKIEQSSGVTSATVRNWLYGKTKRPQFCTICAVVRSLGFELSVGDPPPTSSAPLREKV